VPVVVAVFTTGIVVAELSVAFLLISQLWHEPDWSVLFVSCAYLFSGTMGIAHSCRRFSAARARGKPEARSGAACPPALCVSNVSLTKPYAEHAATARRAFVQPHGRASLAATDS
jgi:hypothetical protein